jgi:hypothetical protein
MDCGEKNNEGFHLSTYCCIPLHPKNLSVVKVITYNISVNSMVKLEKKIWKYVGRSNPAAGGIYAGGQLKVGSDNHLFQKTQNWDFPTNNLTCSLMKH